MDAHNNVSIVTSSITSFRPESATIRYFLTINESDLLGFYDNVEAKHPRYVHHYVDIFFMAAFTLMAFTFNAAMAAFMLQQRQTPSRFPFRFALLSMTVLHLVDGVFDGGIAIAYMTYVFWEFGLFLCQANAFLIQLWLIVLPLTMVHAGIILVCGACGNKPGSDNAKRKRRIHVWVVGVTWVIGISMVLGLFQICWLDVRPYPARMACNLSPVPQKDEPSNLAILTLLIIYIVPVIVLFILAGKCLLILWRDRRQKRQVAHFSMVRNSNEDNNNFRQIPRRLRKDDIRSLYVTWLTLFVIYLFGALPYAIHAYNDPILATSGNDLMPSSNKRWDVCLSPHTDVLVSWLRLFVQWAHPVVVIALSEDIRNEMLVMMFWWRRPRMPISQTVTMTAINDKKKTVLSDFNVFVLPLHGSNGETKTENGIVVDPSIPVLFLASDHGLCMRRPRTFLNNECSNPFELVSSFCDVIADCCRSMPTSYDSEIIIGSATKHLDSRSAKISSNRQKTPRDHSMSVSKNTRDRDLKLGVWPQAARFAGPRQDGGGPARRHGVTPASRPL